MEKGIVYFDVSAYVLFEASGDSDDGTSMEVEYSDVVAEDDAQSCSYGSLYDHSAGVHEIDAMADDFCMDFDGGEGEEEEEEEEEEESGSGNEEEEGVVDQCRGGVESTAKEKLKKSKGCEEALNVKMMNERERDRLFWEACLAS